MDILLSFELDHHCPHLLINFCEFCLFSPCSDLKLNPQSVHQLTQLRIFVEQLRIVLQKYLKFGLKVRIVIVFICLMLVFFIEVGRVKSRWFLA